MLGRNQYFARDMIGLRKEAREVLAEIYLNRKTPFTDPIWVDIYARWLNATDKSMHGKEYELPILRAKAAYYFERINTKQEDFKK